MTSDVASPLRVEVRVTQTASPLRSEDLPQVASPLRSESLPSLHQIHERLFRLGAAVRLFQ